MQAGRPHEVTQLFARKVGTAATDPVRKDLGYAPWLPPLATGTPAQVAEAAATIGTGNGLYRALELLRVKPWGHVSPPGGRLAGLVNINTVQDIDTFRAVLDAQPGNGFAPAEVDYLWNELVASRTVNAANPRTLPDGTAVTVPVPGKSYDDDQNDPTNPTLPLPANQLDRPFKPFGMAEFSATTGFAAGGNLNVNGGKLPFGPGLNDTLLRRSVNPPTYPPMVATDPPIQRPYRVGHPILWLDYNATQSAGYNPAVVNDYRDLPGDPQRAHDYFRGEAARKLMNNLSTVSNSFAVYVTVGFFEVRVDPATGNALTFPAPANSGLPAQYLLGRETYKEIHGDLRQ